MTKLWRSRACVAVGSALLTASLIGGGAVAATQIGSAGIRNNSIRSEDIRDDAVRSRDVSNGTLGRVDLRSGVKEALDRSGSEGPPGPEGPQGPAGPPGPVLDTLGHLLYVTDGSAEIAHLTYRLDRPVALQDISELTFFQELVHGNGNFGANVILGVDANGDGNYGGDDLAWHLGAPAQVPTQLGDDTFVEMDGVNFNMTKVDAPEVPQWYSPNAAGTGFDNTDSDCYSTLRNMVSNCADVRFEPTDEVHVIRLILGGSPSWNDLAVRLTTFSIDGRLEPGVAHAQPAP